MKPKSHKYSNQSNCYADGGQVSKKKTSKKKTPVRRSGDTVQSTSVGSTTDTLRNRRAQQMAELGLKDGGRVKKMKCGGKVRK